MISQSEFPAYFDAVPSPFADFEIPEGTQSVLEIGPGAGSGVIDLIASRPDLEFTLLEPDTAAQCALAWRLRDRGLAAYNVSILPLTLEASPVEAYDLVLACHVICHVPQERQPLFWSAVRARMTQETVARVDSHFGASNPVDRPLSLSVSTDVGRHRYERWYGTRTVSTTEWTAINEYRVLDERGAVLSAERSESPMEVIDEERCLRAITEADLQVTERTTQWLSLSPRVSR